MTTQRPRPFNQSSETPAPKPYAMVSFPKERPQLQQPIGQDKYHENRCHGILHLTLKVQTALHVSTGIVVMGSDVGQKSIPLIKTMMQGTEGQLIIPGSSLKGVVRSVYEAITNSTLAVITQRYKNDIPSERLPCRDKNRLCPASRVFGALDWQGLINFTDARCQSAGFRAGFMPSLYRPHSEAKHNYFKQGKVAGRKFYYHTIKAVDKGQQQGIPVQQAVKEFVFKTQLHYRNLSQAELGTLLIVLGQDKPKHPIALKVGGGKPIGMGTMAAEITLLEQPANLRDRYLSYESKPTQLAGSQLQQMVQKAIAEAHRQQLVQSQQLQELADVLKYPTDREPPEGMY
ncbi:MAG TPA: CRISPR-associated protein [Cyanobacteria bacterium UBA11369]|nr:CRISPR-associated protein [Cyanobacteria bacterium UBA11371]HBE36772.1 CRISPR-associated protein [Cyanobacteria bacterium UBA11368]HBE51162.1 CRISPR-associated protein [Cyanobacteria bacterium UBA11369]